MAYISKKEKRKQKKKELKAAWKKEHKKIRSELTDSFTCPYCGGRLEVFTYGARGRLRPKCRCLKCGLVKRSPRRFYQ